jgi:hypothetical protein
VTQGSLSFESRLAMIVALDSRNDLKHVWCSGTVGSIPVTHVSSTMHAQPEIDVDTNQVWKWGGFDPATVRPNTMPKDAGSAPGEFSRRRLGGPRAETAKNFKVSRLVRLEPRHLSDT